MQLKSQPFGVRLFPPFDVKLRPLTNSCLLFAPSKAPSPDLSVDPQHHRKTHYSCPLTWLNIYVMCPKWPVSLSYLSYKLKWVYDATYLGLFYFVLVNMYFFSFHSYVSLVDQIKNTTSPGHMKMDLMAVVCIINLKKKYLRCCQWFWWAGWDFSIHPITHVCVVCHMFIPKHWISRRAYFVFVLFFFIFFVCSLSPVHLFSQCLCDRVDLKKKRCYKPNIAQLPHRYTRYSNW